MKKTIKLVLASALLCCRITGKNIIDRNVDLSQNMCADVVAASASATIFTGGKSTMI